MARNTIIRSMHDVGLAAWFGGTLANAVALNPAAAEGGDRESTARVANTGWNRWTPVNSAAIGAHVIGSIGLLLVNRRRMFAQRGVTATSAVKTGLMGAALGVTAYSRMLGRRVAQHHDAPAESGTEPAPSTPPQVADAQRKLATLQWAVPASTGALVVVNALMSEQQRPSEVTKGVRARLRR